MDGKQYWIYDDDMQYDAAGNITYKVTFGDADTSKLADAFAPAYFDINLITTTSDAGIAFDRNLDGFNNGDYTTVINSDRQYTMAMVSDAFIAVHLVGGFQGSRGVDADPQTENNGEVTLAEARESELGVVIYREVVRELGPLVDEGLLVVHEIGHLLGPDHEDGGVMAPAHDPLKTSFSAESLVKLRVKTYS